MHTPQLSCQRLTAISAVFLTITTVVVFILINDVAYLKRIAKDYFKYNYKEVAAGEARLICYYSFPNLENDTKALKLSDVNADLCTHINLGITNIENSTIVFSERFKQMLKNDVPLLRQKSKDLKLLLWIGGAGENGFSPMVVKHDTRKVFIKSLKEVLHTYKLDGVDLDWEFPSAYNKERTHFSQLLYEIRQEFKRERKDYLLSIAVAAVEGIALFAYDIREINLYADYVNLMTYDFHFYSHSTPFTGLNAPLFARDQEHSILATLNINYSVNWWLSNGLQRKKLVVGLPTYAHTFNLVNPFNNGLEAPADNYGTCGAQGFASYAEVCWFMAHNIGLKTTFESKAASPYLSSGSEWISYENETSIAIKTQFIRSLDVGGIMVFSLNTDDINGYCLTNSLLDKTRNAKFPLISTIKRNLYTAIV